MVQTGEAQRADVSAQCVMTWTMLNAMDAFAIQGRDFERQGSALQLGPLTVPLVFESADGYVVAIPNGFTGQGTPTGIAFVGPVYGEDKLLAVARAYQDAAGFYRRRPDLPGADTPGIASPASNG